MSSRQRGFTVVELLITVAIGGAVITAAFYFFTRMIGATQRVRSSAAAEASVNKLLAQIRKEFSARVNVSSLAPPLPGDPPAKKAFGMVPLPAPSPPSPGGLIPPFNAAPLATPACLTVDASTCQGAWFRVHVVPPPTGGVAEHVRQVQYETQCLEDARNVDWGKIPMFFPLKDFPATAATDPFQLMCSSSDQAVSRRAVAARLLIEDETSPGTLSTTLYDGAEMGNSYATMLCIRPIGHCSDPDKITELDVTAAALYEDGLGKWQAFRSHLTLSTKSRSSKVEILTY